MAGVHWADRYAVDGILIREVLLREQNEVTASDVRDRRIWRSRVGGGDAAFCDVMRANTGH